MSPQDDRDAYMGDAQDFAHKQSLATSEPEPPLVDPALRYDPGSDWKEDMVQSDTGDWVAVQNLEDANERIALLERAMLDAGFSLLDLASPVVLASAARFKAHQEVRDATLRAMWPYYWGPGHETKAPHCPAAFINAIAEEGSKAEAVANLQEVWNELQLLRSNARGFAEKVCRLTCAPAHKLGPELDRLTAEFLGRP